MKEECGLKLNEEKTKIVYCKDSNRRGDSEHISFDFLGFTFRPRGARNRKTGQNFTAFLPAISKKSMKRIKEAVRAWKLNHKTFACLLDISNEVDTQISGWMNYYMKFGRSEFRKLLNYINERLTRWVMRKYKRFSKGRKFVRAYDWLVEYAAHKRHMWIRKCLFPAKFLKSGSEIRKISYLCTQNLQREPLSRR